MKFMQIKPQKARGKFLESLWTDPAWSAETKYDGDRRIAQFGGFVVRFTGTRQSVDGTGFVEKTSNLPQFNTDPYKDTLDGTVLDGEIVAPWASKLPGGESKWVTSIMGSSPERAIQIQKEKGWLEYMVFDCLWYKGKDLRSIPLEQRRNYVALALDAWGNDYTHRVESEVSERLKRSMWEQAREGLVFKHESNTYGDESLWVKLKKEFTADVICMGFEPGKGKYAGSVGAIIFGQYKDGKLVRCGSCRGFSDNQMNAMTLHPKKYIDRVLQIAHNGREMTGAFRHPRFRHWREDKNAKDCIFDLSEV